MKDTVPQIRLEEEKNLLSFMEGRINANLIRKLLSIKDKEKPDGFISSYLKGYYLPLSEKVGENVYRLCRDVQKSLSLEELNIEYVISSNPEINASSFFNFNYSGKNPHCIILNSGLLELLEESELKFVVGHEIGHLIYEHTHFRRIIQFVYPEFNRLPYLLRSLYELWCQLGEISADRIGMIAAKQIEPATLAMFKLSSGLGQKHLKISYPDLIEMVEKIIGEMAGSPFQPSETHPSNPIRVKALRLFHQSDTWKGLMKKSQVGEDKWLQERTAELVTYLKRCPGFDIEKAEMDFLAAAGIMLLTSDKEISEVEIDYLNNLLSQYLYMPHNLIQAFAKEKNVNDRVQQSADYILGNCPQRTRGLFASLLPIIMRDRKLDDGEVDIAVKIGVEILKIPFQEVVDMLLEAISEQYSPLA